MVVQYAILAMSVYAFVDAVRQRPDAYTAAEKMTKPIWLMILCAAVALSSFLFPLFSVLGITVAACGSGLYLADVRPRLREVQGKSR